MNLVQIVFWLAVASGAVSAATGNRTAWALLASVALCLALGHEQVPFNFAVWVLIDLAVVLVIIHPRMTRCDCIILALFIPGWCFYLLPDAARFWGSFSVVVAQLLLTFPVESLRRSLASLATHFRNDPFDKMVVA